MDVPDRDGQPAAAVVRDGARRAPAVLIPAVWTGSAQTDTAAEETPLSPEPADNAAPESARVPISPNEMAEGELSADIVSSFNPAQADLAVQDGLDAKTLGGDIQAAPQTGAAPEFVPKTGSGVSAAANPPPESAAARALQSDSEAKIFAALSEGVSSGSLAREGDGGSAGPDGRGEGENAAPAPGGPSVQTVAIESVRSEETPEKDFGNTQTFRQSARRIDAENVDQAVATPAGGGVGSADRAIRTGETARTALSQITEKLDPAAFSRGETLQIVLEPDELGSVAIRMETTDQGVSISILADNRQVRQALEGSLGQLATALRECGVTTDIIRVEPNPQSESDARFQSGAFLSNPNGGFERQYRQPLRFVTGPAQTVQEELFGQRLSDPVGALRLNLYG